MAGKGRIGPDKGGDWAERPQARGAGRGARGGKRVWGLGSRALGLGKAGGAATGRRGRLPHGGRVRVSGWRTVLCMRSCLGEKGQRSADQWGKRAVNKGEWGRLPRTARGQERRGARGAGRGVEKCGKRVNRGLRHHNRRLGRGGRGAGRGVKKSGKRVNRLHRGRNHRQGCGGRGGGRGGRRVDARRRGKRNGPRRSRPGGA